MPNIAEGCGCEPAVRVTIDPTPAWWGPAMEPGPKRNPVCTATMTRDITKRPCTARSWPRRHMATAHGRQTAAMSSINALSHSMARCTHAINTCAPTDATATAAHRRTGSPARPSLMVLALLALFTVSAVAVVIAASSTTMAGTGRAAGRHVKDRAAVKEALRA